MDLNVLIILFFIVILLILNNTNNAVFTLSFVFLASIIIKDLKNLNKESFSGAGAGTNFTTDNINTKMESADDAIISRTDLLSGKTSLPQIPSQESILKKKYDIPIVAAARKKNKKCGANGGAGLAGIIDLYDMRQGQIDDGMATVMSQTGKLAKDSFTNRTRLNKRAFSKYFQEELAEQENREGWWDNDEFDMLV